MTNTSLQVRTLVMNYQAEHALARVEELSDFGYIESVLKLLPDIWSQTIAISHTQLVFAFEWMWRSVEEVSRGLADIDGLCCSRIVDVRPEVRYREFGSDGNADSAQKRSRCGDDTCTVV